MFLPLHDGVPLKNMKTPLATRLLIVTCIGVYILTFYARIGADEMVAGFGLIPAVLFGSEILPAGYPFVPAELTLVTNIFLHGSLFHLLGNMLFLWVFGDNVEDAMGHWRFILFFVLCGTAASLLHAVHRSARRTVRSSEPPAAYRALSPPTSSVSTGAYLGAVSQRHTARLPAYWAIGFWFLLQFASAFFGGDDGVGWFAHLGGFVAGACSFP